MDRRVVYLRSNDLASLKEDLRHEGVTLFVAAGTPVVRQGVAEGCFERDVGLFYRVKP